MIRFRLPLSHRWCNIGNNRLIHTTFRSSILFVFPLEVECLSISFSFCFFLRSMMHVINLYFVVLENFNYTLLFWFWPTRPLFQILDCCTNPQAPSDNHCGNIRTKNMKSPRNCVERKSNITHTIVYGKAIEKSILGVHIV